MTMEAWNIMKLLEYNWEPILTVPSPSTEMLGAVFVFLIFNSQITVILSKCRGNISKEPKPGGGGQWDSGASL